MKTTTVTKQSTQKNSACEMKFGGCEFLKTLDLILELDNAIAIFYFSQQYATSNNRERHEQAMSEKKARVNALAKQVEELGVNKEELRESRRHVDYLKFLDGKLVRPLTKKDDYYMSRAKFENVANKEIRAYDIFFDDYNFYIGGVDVGCKWREFMSNILPNSLKDEYAIACKRFIEAKQHNERCEIQSIEL